MNREKEWRRVLVEGFAVVVSILLAFAIDAWWNDLGERRQEQEALLVVQADLEDAIEQLAGYIDVVGRISAASLDAYRALSTTVPTSARDSISDLLVASTIRRTMSLPRTGYTDLVSTGGLRLIRDRRVRNEVIRFYERADRLEQIAEKNSTTYTDGHLGVVLIRDGLVIKKPNVDPILDPADGENAIRDWLGPEFRHRTDPLWSFSPDSREWDRVRGALMQSGRGTQTNLTIARRLQEEAAQLNAMIDSYLGGGAL